MEDLTERWENFTLSGPESRGIPVASFRNSKGGMLAAKFLTRRNINIEAVARTFKPLGELIRALQFGIWVITRLSLHSRKKLT